MKTNIQYLLLLGCALLASCARQEESAVPGLREIRFSASIGTYDTKATDTAFEEGDVIGLMIESPFFPNGMEPLHYALKMEGGGLKPFDPLYWPVEMPSVEKASFMAYYPFEAVVGGKVVIDEDQFHQDAYKHSDYMSASTFATPSDDVVHLQFKHLMSRFNLAVIDQLETDSFSGEQTDNFLSVEVGGMNMSAYFRFTRIQVVGEETSTAYPARTGDRSYSLLLPPQTVAPVITVHLSSGKTLTYTVTAPIDFTAGKQVSASLVLSEDEMAFNWTITDWADATTELNFVQADAPQPANEIWYKTTDGNPVTTISQYGFGSAEIVSNEYNQERDVCILSLDRDVTYLGEPFGSEASNVVWISLPEGIKYIASYAFEGCSFESITIPQSVESFGSLNPFIFCNNLKSFYGKYATEDHLGLIEEDKFISFAFGADVQTYSVPNSVKVINTYAFYHSNLREILLPDGLETIDHLAFEGSAIESVSLPSTLIDLGYEAFCGCDNLTELTIPESVEELGNNPIAWADNVEYFYGKYSSEDHKCLIKDGRFIGLAPAGTTEYAIPEGVNTIVRNAVVSRELSSLSIPSSVTQIEMYAFSSCPPNAVFTIFATNPPAGSENMFPSSSSLYVPTESVDAYKNAEYWSDYADCIFPIPDND